MRCVAWLLVLTAIGCGGSSPGTREIVHVFNTPYVDRDTFASDRRQTAKEPLAEDEIDSQYESFLADIEAAQQEQLVVLRGLMMQHGVRELFAEGVADSNVERFRGRISELFQTELPMAESQLVRANVYLQRSQPGSPDYEKAKAVRDTALKAREAYRIDLLKIGAIGRLLLLGEAYGVLPLEEIAPQGSNRDTQDRRESEIVKRLLASGKPTAIVVLATQHDLSDDIKKASKSCTYRVIDGDKVR